MSYIPARAADSQVRFVISVINPAMRYGIFDIAGCDVQLHCLEDMIKKE